MYYCTCTFIIVMIVTSSNCITATIVTSTAKITKKYLKTKNYKGSYMIQDQNSWFFFCSNYTCMQPFILVLCCRYMGVAWLHVYSPPPILIKQSSLPHVMLLFPPSLTVYT